MKLRVLKFKKNPDSAPGVAKSYTSEYPLICDKSLCWMLYTARAFENLWFFWVLEKHCLKKWISSNDAFKNYESTDAGITLKTQKS